MRIRISKRRSSLVIPLPYGAAFGFLAERAAGLAAGLGSVLALGLIFQLSGVPGDLARVTSPRAVLAQDRQVALLLWLLSGLMAGLAFGLATGLAVGLAAGLFIGLAAGLAIGFVISRLQTTWLSFMLNSGRLALRGRLPWSLMDFLADAHQRGVLRQAGAVYQFRHIELQHRLANRDAQAVSDD